MTDTPVRDKRSIGTLAWVALGASAVVAAIELWSNTSQASAIYNVIFAGNIFIGLSFLGGIYLGALVLDIVAGAALKGWRNRVIALAGIILLLAPVAYGLWVAAAHTPY